MPFGPEGSWDECLSLVVPNFTFKHEAEKDPIIDPARDLSEMGVITEAVRKLLRARRSIAYRHSVAAMGPKASMVTEVDPELCVFDLRSSFGKMLEDRGLVGITAIGWKIRESFLMREVLKD